MQLAPLTDEDRSRLADQERRAWGILESRALAIAGALIVQPESAIPMLLLLAKDVASVFATKENAQLVLRELQATGAISSAKAMALAWLVDLHHDPPPDLIEHPPSPPMPMPDGGMAVPGPDMELER